MRNILFDKKYHMLWFVLGLVCTGFLILPYLVLGRGAYVQITDQLDGEVLNYLYAAKYLFDGDVIKECMGGVSKLSMLPPAPLGVLFYKLLSPFAAYAVFHCFCLLTGYFGMFVLLRKLTGNGFISMLCAVLFVYLPFYPVYGLSILGQPLLCFCIWELTQREGKEIRPKDIVHLAGIILYACASSLALVGFAIILAGVGILCFLLVKGRKEKVGFAAGFGALTFTYAIFNLDLIKSIVGISDMGVSHRVEMIPSAMPDFFGYVWELFSEGGSYAKSYNLPILILVLGVLVTGILFRVEEEGKGLLCRLLSMAVLICILAGLWRWEGIVSIRQKLGGFFVYFQADRIYWLLPLLWFVMLGLSLKMVLERIVKSSFLYVIMLRSILACGMILIGQSVLEYQNGTIFHNLRLMIFPDTYHLMTWDEFYAEDLFAEANARIENQEGMSKASYKTLSLGISPAAALYNGFYTLDGYSNYYALDYKHAFRKIISTELDKNPEMKVYFDAWGNRCYLLNSETGNYMTVPKGAGTYRNLELDTKAAYDMGARFIFSAMPIENAKTMHLEAVNEVSLDLPGSYYELYIYKIVM